MVVQWGLIRNRARAFVRSLRRCRLRMLSSTASSAPTWGELNTPSTPSGLKSVNGDYARRCCLHATAYGVPIPCVLAHNSGFQSFQLLVAEFFHINQLIVGFIQSKDDFVELQMYCLRIPILSVLD